MYEYVISLLSNKQQHALNVYIEQGSINTVHVYAEILGSMVIGDPTLY